MAHWRRWIRVCLGIGIGAATAVSCGPDRLDWQEACEAHCANLEKCKPGVSDCLLLFCDRGPPEQCEIESARWHDCWANAPCEQPRDEPKLCEVERLAMVECERLHDMEDASTSEVSSSTSGETE